MNRLILIAILTLFVATLTLNTPAQQINFDTSDAPAPRGMALPALQVSLNAPVDGILSEVLIEDGQTVKAGQPLARMDDGIQKATVEAARLRASAEARLIQARLEREDAELSLQRITRAFEQDAAQDWEVRRAQLRFDVTKAQIEGVSESMRIAKAELELEQARLDRFTLTAPWDGYIQRVAVDPGATLARSDTILRMVSMHKLEAEIYVPARLQPQLKAGQTYQLTALEPVNRQLSATLTFADRMIDPGSSTFRCVFAIDNTEGKLPAGFAVMLRWPQD